MTDRELLELAAKAAGYEIKGDWFDTHRGGGFMVGVQVWNPLTDDGDALRLAVKLRADVAIGQSVKVVCVSPDGETVAKEVLPLGDDENAATRRAIVRAAAEIAKGMSAEG